MHTLGILLETILNPHWCAIVTGTDDVPVFYDHCSDQWPWAVWYPLRRKSEFGLLPEEETRKILSTHVAFCYTDLLRWIGSFHLFPSQLEFLAP